MSFKDKIFQIKPKDLTCTKPYHTYSFANVCLVIPRQLKLSTERPKGSKLIRGCGKILPKKQSICVSRVEPQKERQLAVVTRLLKLRIWRTDYGNAQFCVDLRHSRGNWNKTRKYVVFRITLETLIDIWTKYAAPN